jgi:hypothetical protein
MAKLILTGEHEAIDLKALRGEQVLQIDAAADDVIKRNGGFARFAMEMKNAVFGWLEVNATYSLKSSKNKREAA